MNLLYILLAISYCIQAETIFYRNDGKPLSKEEHDIAYTIKLQYQFPLSLVHGEVVENEIEVMQKELNTHIPEVKVAFIPTTIYELFFMHYIQTNIENINKASGDLLQKFKPIDPDQPRENALFNDIEAHKSINDHFAQEKQLDHYYIHALPQVKQCHLECNNYIVTFLAAKYNTPINNLSITHYEDIIEHSKIIQTFEKEILKRFPDITPLNTSFNTTLFKQSISLEYSAQQKGNWLLYRGTKNIDQEPLKPLNISLSFGNSWLAGILFDLGASAYVHYAAYATYLPEQNQSYVLPISKKQYATNTLITQGFYISPLLTIAGIIGKGEFFHSRTKVKSLESLPLGFANIALKNIPSFYEISTNPQDKHNAYLYIYEYIQNHKTRVKQPPIPHFDRILNTNII